MTLNPFFLPPIPDELWRIEDDLTFIKYDNDDDQGFNCFTSTQCMAFNQRITPLSVKDHLENGQSIVWKGLISLGTFDKARREIEWRERLHHKSIWAYKIETAGLQWESMVWNQQQNISLRYLTDGSADIMIFKASELIQALGLSGNIKREAELGAVDEWLALEWVPKSMILERWQISDDSGRRLQGNQGYENLRT
ncbi:uncharacterized protein KY384_002909 [Bacidia gigantensis]|uniref:uncharacterized protein n=1 Tax=Bacidia gigantensis TaxID=2732470 RepID=UPI001D0571CE|nr:uncharacterized protein KY384_002909 [Bacidia gigantensis]KAG8532424.1 hypothetical protein KY384_002909 [Bacidia gigantensis]